MAADFGLRCVGLRRLCPHAKSQVRLKTILPMCLCDLELLHSCCWLLLWRVACSQRAIKVLICEKVRDTVARPENVQKAQEGCCIHRLFCSHHVDCCLSSYGTAADLQLEEGYDTYNNRHWQLSDRCKPAGTPAGGPGRGAGAAGAVGTEMTSASPGNIARTNPGVFSGRRPVMRGYTSSRK